MCVCVARAGYYPPFFYPAIGKIAKSLLPQFTTAYYIKVRGVGGCVCRVHGFVCRVHVCVRMRVLCVCGCGCVGAHAFVHTVLHELRWAVVPQGRAVGSRPMGSCALPRRLLPPPVLQNFKGATGGCIFRCYPSPFQIWSRTRAGFSLVEEREEMPNQREVALEVLPRAAAAAAARG